MSDKIIKAIEAEINRDAQQSASTIAINVGLSKAIEVVKANSVDELFTKAEVDEITYELYSRGSVALSKKFHRVASNLIEGEKS